MGKRIISVLNRIITQDLLESNKMGTQIFRCYSPSSELSLYHSFIIFTRMTTLLFPRVGKACIICEPNKGPSSTQVSRDSYSEQLGVAGIWKVTGQNPTGVLALTPFLCDIGHFHLSCLFTKLKNLYHSYMIPY